MKWMVMTWLCGLWLVEFEWTVALGWRIFQCRCIVPRVRIQYAIKEREQQKTEYWIGLCQRLVWSSVCHAWSVCCACVICKLFFVLLSFRKTDKPITNNFEIWNPRVQESKSPYKKSNLYLNVKKKNHQVHKRYSAKNLLGKK